MKSEILMLTPQMAESFLEINTSNRKVRPSHVKATAEAMRRGEWQLSPQGISISNEGVILDGQHRLKAVVLSGATVPMLVWRGVDQSTFAILDRGLGRTIADATRLPAKHAGVLSFFHYFTCGGSRKGTPKEIEDINLVFGDVIAELLAFAPSIAKGVSQVGVIASAVFMAHEGEKDFAFDIYRRLTLGSIEGLPSSATALVKQILRGGISRSQGGEAQVEAFSKGLVVFSEENKDRKVLSYTDGIREDARHRLSKVLIKGKR